MLNREEEQQRQVDDDGEPYWLLRPVVDPPGQLQVGEERHGPGGGNEERRVGKNRVADDGQTAGVCAFHSQR